MKEIVDITFEIISDNPGAFLGIAISILLMLVIIILEERNRRKKVERSLKEMDRRLKTLRETHGIMVKELTNRIDELQHGFTKRRRMINLVMNLTGVLGTVETEEDIPELLCERIMNLLNVENVYFFEAVERGFKFVLSIHKTVFKDQQLFRGDLVYKLGEGPVGYVAKKRYTMDKDAMRQDALVDGLPEDVLRDPFGIKYDVLSPLVHYETLFGVIAVSGLKPEKLKSLDYQEPYEESLAFAMETVQIISEIGAMALHAAQLRARLQKMADTDGLTGLYNKRYFLEEMDRLIDEARAKDTSIGIFMLDIDFFKKYNDTNGHPQGDMLLKGIARILKKLSESMGGIAARYGGEEFIVALPGKDKIQTIKFAEMVRQIVERTKFPHGEKQPGGRVTISGGISVFPFDGTTKEQLIEKADEALYRAKKQGKNKVFSAV